MKQRELQAVILVAGRGQRLRPLTSTLPKSLIQVSGKTVLGRLLDLLYEAGVRSIVLVTGYRARRIRQYVAKYFPHLSVRFVHNPIYARTNTLYSLWRARKVVEDRPFLLIDGDLVFEPRVLRSVFRHDGQNVLACDSRAALDAEAVRASGQSDGRILHVGKNSVSNRAVFGESIGLARIGRRTSRRLFAVCRKLLQKRGKGHYYEAAFQALIEEGAVFRAADIRGAKWVEIDTKADLRRTQALFRESAKRAG